jgi:hypothetical protein
MNASRAIYNVYYLRSHKNILDLRVQYFCNTCVGISKWNLDGEENVCKLLSKSEVKFLRRTAGFILMHKQNGNTREELKI